MNGAGHMASSAPATDSDSFPFEAVPYRIAHARRPNDSPAARRRSDRGSIRAGAAERQHPCGYSDLASDCRRSQTSVIEIGQSIVVNDIEYTIDVIGLLSVPTEKSNECPAVHGKAVCTGLRA